MKITPQILLWSYILLPAICLLLTPTFLMTIAKVQQQKAKAMATVINSRAKAAATMARNQAKSQRKWQPASKFSTGPVQHSKASKFKRAAQMPQDIFEGARVNPEVIQRTWNQQEESMGQLQNMWNMNGFGIQPSGVILREGPGDFLMSQKKKGGHHHHQPHHHLHRSSESEITGLPLGHPKKHGEEAFFGRNVFDDMVSLENPLESSERVANPEPTFGKKKKKFQPSYRPNYYPQSSYGNYHEHPPYYNSYYARENEPGSDFHGEIMFPLERDANPDPTLKKKKIKNGFSYPQYGHSPSRPYFRRNEDVQEEIHPGLDMTNANRHESSPSIVGLQEPSEAKNPSENVGCGLDDDIFGNNQNMFGKKGKKDDGLFENYDPSSYYQRAVDEASELNKQISEAAKGRWSFPNVPEQTPQAEEAKNLAPLEQSPNEGQGPQSNNPIEKSALASPDPTFHHHHIHPHVSGYTKTHSFSTSHVYGYSPVTSGFEHQNSGAQAQAIANGHTVPLVAPGGQHLNSFGLPSSQSIAQAQSFSAGGFSHAQAQAQSQAIASAFRQSEQKEVISQPREDGDFIMPHLEELPVRHLLQDMENGATRLPRQDFLSGLGLATDIVHSSLDLSSKMHENRERTPEDTEKTMSFVTGIVDSSIKANQKMNQENFRNKRGAIISNDESTLTPHSKKDLLDDGDVSRAAIVAPSDSKADAINKPSEENLTNLNDEMIEMINPDDVDSEEHVTIGPVHEANNTGEVPKDQFLESLKNDNSASSESVESLEEHTHNRTLADLKPNNTLTPSTSKPSEHFPDQKDDLNVVEDGEFPSLTPEEIEDIQFSIPDDIQQYGNSSLDNLNHTIDAQLNNTHKIPEQPTLVDPQNKTQNASGNPFEIIEAEMSILTEEQKEAFMKQEMALINEVIEETLKMQQQPHAKDDALSSPHLIDVVKFQDHEPFGRQANQEFDAILGAHKEKVDNIQKEATDDGDLLMISFIGDSIIKDLEDRRRKTEEKPKRTRREIVGFNPNGVPLTRLVSDPTTKIDVPKTLKNVGSIVRHSFENPRAPMYHVRNMLGNAKDTIMSAVKMPPINLLIPSQYEIAKTSRRPRLGAINRKMFSRTKPADDTSEENTTADPLEDMDTVHKLHGMVKQSVKSSQKVVDHANEAATDLRNVVYTIRHSAPRLLIPGQVPFIATRTTNAGSNLLGRKAVLLTPRIVDVEENAVGAKEDQPEQFVGIGNILDAVGLTKPNPPEVELKKIVLEPTSIDVMKQWSMPKELWPTNPVTTWIKDTLKSDKRQETLGSLREAEESVGATSLKEFLDKMRQEMKAIVGSQYAERKKKRKEKAKNLRQNSFYSNFKKEYRLSKKKPSRKTIVPIEEPVQKPEDIVQAAKPKIDYESIIDENSDVTLPPEVLNVFTGPNSQSDTRKQEKTTTAEGSFEDLEQPVPESNITDFKDEQVGLYLMPELMKPFMGQPSADTLDNFMRENGDEISADRKKHPVYPILPLNLNVTIPPAAPLKLLNLAPLVEQIGPEVHEEKGSQMSETDDLGHVLGAINPVMFEKYYNESMKIRGKEEAIIRPNLEEKNSSNSNAADSEARTSMNVKDQYKKPFMGLIPQTKVHSALNQFNNNLSEDGDEESEGNPIKNVVFSGEEDDYNFV